MALTRRQKLSYQDTADGYRSANTDSKDGNRFAVDRGMAQMHHTARACHYQSALESNQFVPPLGRSEQDNLDTLDRFYFESGTNWKDGDVIRLTTTGHPLLGAYFVVQGFGRERPGRTRRQGNFLLVFAKRTQRPEWMQNFSLPT